MPRFVTTATAFGGIRARSGDCGVPSGVIAILLLIVRAAVSALKMVVKLVLFPFKLLARAISKRG